LNTSNIVFEPYSNATINAADTYVRSPGINLLGISATFNGNYTQRGGFINFTTISQSDDLQPLFSVNGSVNVFSVQISGEIPSSMKILILVRTLSRSLNMRDMKFLNVVGDSTHVRIGTSSQDIYLERVSKLIYFFVHNYAYVAVGGAVFLFLILFIVTVLIVRRRARGQYTRIN